MKVLIVDDCELTREMLGFVITDIADTDYAENGADAVQMATDSINAGAHYDLICLDITMPVMGGLEALKKIREVESGADAAKSKIFMITASSSPDDMIEAITDGECDDYLTKPVIGQAFKELLRKHALVE
jgi:two-component system chemotaxis response regulator CheY